MLSLWRQSNSASENAKNYCGKKHFDSLDVPYAVIKNADDL